MLGQNKKFFSLWKNFLNKVFQLYLFQVYKIQYLYVQLHEVQLRFLHYWISKFDENKWFYIQRIKTNQSLFKLGIKKIKKNDILIVKFNNRGIIEDKKILSINDMNDIKFSKDITEKEFKQNDVLFKVFSSIREKANAPARNRSKD